MQLLHHQLLQSCPNWVTILLGCIWWHTRPVTLQVCEARRVTCGEPTQTRNFSTCNCDYSTAPSATVWSVKHLLPICKCEACHGIMYSHVIWPCRSLGSYARIKCMSCFRGLFRAGLHRWKANDGVLMRCRYCTATHADATQTDA